MEHPLAQRIIEAARRYGQMHPSISEQDIANMLDLARNRAEMIEWLGNPEAFVDLHERGKIPGQWIYGLPIGSKRP